MSEPVDRTIAEDLASPVDIQPGKDEATPPDWTWRRIGSSLPNAATFNLSHSDVSRVIIDVLRPSDSPPEALFVISKDIPIIIIDSLDKYWAGEARQTLPLNGIRVPVEQRHNRGSETGVSGGLGGPDAVAVVAVILSQRGQTCPPIAGEHGIAQPILEANQSGIETSGASHVWRSLTQDFREAGE